MKMETSNLNMENINKNTKHNIKWIKINPIEEGKSLDKMHKN